jgi:proline racemase
MWTFNNGTAVTKTYTVCGKENMEIATSILSYGDIEMHEPFGPLSHATGVGRVVVGGTYQVEVTSHVRALSLYRGDHVDIQ